MTDRIRTLGRLARHLATTTIALTLLLLTLLPAWPALAGPVVTSVSPNYSGSSINAGTFMSGTTVGGTGFCPGVRVQLYQNGAYVGSSFPATYSTATSLNTVSINFPGPAGNYFIGAIDDLGNCGGSQVNPTTALMVRPIITSLSPSSVQAGSATFTLTINGAGFGSGSVIKWNGTVLPATYVSATQLTAQIPSSYLTSATTASIYASDPSGTVFNATSFSFPIQPLVPTISSISTISGNGTPTTGIRVFGTNFFNGSYVTGNSANLGSVFPSNGGTQFDVYLATSGELINGTSTICVTNSGPTPGTTCTGYAFDSTKFVLSSISPTVTITGTGITLTANGANFPSNATIRWNGADLPTTYVSSTQLTASISSGLLGTPGSATITVYNPNTSAASNALTLTINNQTPTITSLSITTSPVGQAFTLYINGTGFLSSGSSVSFDNDTSGSTVTYYGPTQLSMIYNPSYTTGIDLLRTPGPHNITVTNSAYNGGTSNAATLTLVNPTPTLSSISPTTAPMDSGFVLTATGSSFDRDSIIQWNGTNLQTDYSSSTSLVAWVPLSNVQNGGTATITVYNPGPGGGTSGSKSLTISYPVPTVSSSSPSMVSMNASTTTVTLTGTHFFNTSTVQWGGTALTPTYIDDTHLSVSVPSSKFTSPGTTTVTVTNPTPGGGISNNYTFVVTPTLQVGALTQSGWNVSSTITWSSSTNVSNQSVNCGTTPSQVIQGASATCIYSTAGTYTVSGTSTVGTVTNVATPTQTVTVPLLTPTAATFSNTIDGRPANPNADTYTLPVPLAVTVVLTRPSTVGIMDPLNLSASTLQVQLGNATPVTTSLSQVDVLDYTTTSSLSQTGTYTITFQGTTTGGISLNASTTATLTLSSVNLTIGSLTQDGWNVDAPVSWPSGTNAVQVNCGTSPTQTFTSPAGTCVYNTGGNFVVTGTYREPYHNAQVSAQPVTVTIPILPPGSATLTTTVDGRTANPNADTYIFPVPLAVGVALGHPTGIGIVDSLDLTRSTIQVQRDNTTPVQNSLSETDPIDYTATESLSYAGTYTITLKGVTLQGSSLNTSTTVVLTHSSVNLQVGDLTQDDWNVDAPISWPAGVSWVRVNCGTSATQTFVGDSGTCVYSQGGTYSVIGTFTEPYHNTQITTPVATVTIPLLPPSAATITTTVDSRPANPNADTYTLPVPLAIAITLARPSGVGILDPLDVSRSIIQLQLGNTTPIQNSLSEVDPQNYTATDSLSHAGAYTITLRGITVGGTSFNTSTTVALTLSAVQLQVGALAQDGWNVNVPVSWPNGANWVQVSCGTTAIQTFVGTSDTCVYDKGGTYSVVGTYLEPYHNTRITTPPATVTIPIIPPSAATISPTLNGLQPTSDGSVAPFHFPASLNTAIVLTRGDGIGIVDPLDLSNSHLVVTLSGGTSVSTSIRLGDDPLNVSASNSLAGPGSYTLQLNGRTEGGNPVTVSLPLQVLAGSPALTIGALTQDGFDVLVPISWPTSLNGAAPISINCGTSNAQVFTDTSVTCRYTKADTFQVIGTYQSPETNSPTLRTAPQSVTIPLRVPTGATVALTVNNQPVSGNSITAYRFPGTLTSAITLTLPPDAGIVDPLDSSTSKMRVQRSNATTTAAYRVIPGTDPTQTTNTASLDAPDTYTLTLDGHTMSGHAVTLTQSVAVASANVMPVVGDLVQDGPNVTVAISWPDAVTPVSIDCGTSASQTFTGQSGQCTYNRFGQFQVTGRYVDPEDNQPLAAPPAVVTIPVLVPINPQIVLQVNNQPVADTAPTYRLPSIITTTVIMQRPDGIGVLDHLNTDTSSITLVPDNLPSLKYRPSVNTDPLVTVATGELRYAGHYTIQFIGKTVSGQQVTASAPLLVSVVTATLQADPPVQDGDAVTVHVQWPDGGPVGTIQCGFMSQRLTTTSGTCRYTKAGIYQIIGYFIDLARGATVATDPVNVTIAQIEPITPVLSIQSVNSQGLTTDTGGAFPVSTTQQPDSYPVQIQLLFTLQRPDGMGILDSLDLDRSSLTATAVKDGAQPVRLALKRGTDKLTYTASVPLTDFGPEAANPSDWRYHFSLTGQSFGGTSYQADTELVGPIGATPFVLQVRKGTPQIPYAPAAYAYTLNAVNSSTKQEPFTSIWTISNGDEALQTVQKDRMHITFDQPGTYQIQLSVTGPFSQPTTWSDTVVVPMLPDTPTATILSTAPKYNRPPAQYRFRPSVPALPDRRERLGTPTWTIDDDSKTAPSATTTFTTPGDHQVSVNIPTSYGRTVAGAMTVTINPNQPPTGTVDCSKSFYSISLKKYVISCRATATDPDGRIKHLIWKVPELTYEKDDVSAISLEQTDPQAITVELHIIDDSAAETVVSTPVDMASLPRK